MTTKETVMICYFVFVNLTAFAMYGADKVKARKGKWRISEYSLMAAAIVGGSIGAIAGMRIFHHKTKKMKFYVGLPIILTLQVIFITGVAAALHFAMRA